MYNPSEAKNNGLQFTDNRVLLELSTEPWERLILYCRDDFPFGDLKLRIERGEPMEPLDEKPKTRFKRTAVRPTFYNGKGDFEASQPWQIFMLYCSRRCSYADVEVRIVNAEPTQLIKVDRVIRFDNIRTIPELLNDLYQDLTLVDFGAKVAV